MKILVSGSHGLIGSALVPALAARGHRVLRLVRTPNPASPDHITWDPGTGRIETGALDGIDAAVHLAGESIAAGRWTEAKKARIRESRVRGTRSIAEALARLSQRPSALVCASATGYYGDRGAEILDEDSAPGAGFLAEVVRAWEAAAGPAREAGIRVVHLRSGVVLSQAGGALARLLPIFRLGLGGRLGSGRQFMPWIVLDDEVEAIVHTLTRGDLRGPVNVASPHPVTNQEFAATLGQVLRRPALVAAPAAMLRLALGELAGELLASQRVHPAKLLAAGYVFRYLELRAALRHLLEPPRSTAPQGRP